MRGVWCLGRLDWLTAFRRSAAALTSLGPCTTSCCDPCGSWHRPPLQINYGNRDATRSGSNHHGGILNTEYSSTNSILSYTILASFGSIDLHYKYGLPSRTLIPNHWLLIPDPKAQFLCAQHQSHCQDIPSEHNSQLPPPERLHIYTRSELEHSLITLSD